MTKKLKSKSDIQIGQKFHQTTAKKIKRLMVVVDIYKTYNHQNELVETKFMCKQLDTELDIVGLVDVPSTTILRSPVE